MKTMDEMNDLFVEGTEVDLTNLITANSNVSPSKKRQSRMLDNERPPENLNRALSDANYSSDSND